MWGCLSRRKTAYSRSASALLVLTPSLITLQAKIYRVVSVILESVSHLAYLLVGVPLDLGDFSKPTMA